MKRPTQSLRETNQSPVSHEKTNVILQEGQCHLKSVQVMKRLVQSSKIEINVNVSTRIGGT